MKAVVQRCLSASVSVNGEIIGKIERGSVVFLGISQSDTEEDTEYTAKKIIDLRIFEDENGKTNLGLKEIEGGLLVIPNFTIYGDTKKGKRPSFTEAASPQRAAQVFNSFLEYTRVRYSNVESGSFGADMKVSLVNDGPFTIIVNSDRNDK